MPVALAILSIIIIFAVLTGRATNAIRAALGEPLVPVVHPKTTGLTSQKSSSSEDYHGLPQPNQTGSNYVPSPNLFGLGGKTITNSFPITKYLSGDSSYFGHQAVMEWNYLFPWNTSNPIKLPGTSSDEYTVKYNQYSDKIGGQLVLQSPNRGMMAFLHFLKTIPAQVGTTLRGGDIIGYSGWPLDPAYGNGVSGPLNAHLAVTVDSLGYSWLKHYE